MMDVLIIDKDNEIAPAIHEGTVMLSVFYDEIQALNAVETMRPEIIVLNYAIQKSRTAEFISVLFQTSEHSKIILVAENLADEEVLECLIAGAKGYLQIHEVKKFINKLLCAVNAGEAWITRRMVAKLLDKLRNHSA